MDPLGEDVYYINRVLGGEQATKSSFSHSFVALTNINPKTKEEIVTTTISWGNKEESKWFINDPDDLKAAQDAINRNIGKKKYGGENLEKYIIKAFNEIKDQKEEYNLLFNNCKQKALELIKKAISLQKKDFKMEKIKKIQNAFKHKAKNKD